MDRMIQKIRFMGGFKSFFFKYILHYIYIYIGSQC